MAGAAPFVDRVRNEMFLAPLTRGGNGPYRQLCVELGARVTVCYFNLSMYCLLLEERLLNSCSSFSSAFMYDPSVYRDGFREAASKKR